MNPEQHRLVTGTGSWLQGPTSTASCDNAGKSYAEITETVGAMTWTPSLSRAWVPEGAWTPWRHSSRACLVGAALRAALR
ncbi:MAG: hypothetical protein WCF12_10150 [Propionicimonas sp.]